MAFPPGGDADPGGAGRPARRRRDGRLRRRRHPGGARPDDRLDGRPDHDHAGPPADPDPDAPPGRRSRTVAPAPGRRRRRPGSAPGCCLRGPSGYGIATGTPSELVDRRIATVDELPPPADGAFHASVRPVPAAVAARSTWSARCPVTLAELRYVTVGFRGFDGRAHTGELLVHRDVAADLVTVFRRALRRRLPDRAHAGHHAGRAGRAAHRRRQHHRCLQLPPGHRLHPLVRARVRPGGRRRPVPEPVRPGRRWCCPSSPSRTPTAAGCCRG